MGRDEYNSADEKIVAAREQETKNDRMQELEDLRTLLATRAGERVMKRLFSEGRIFHTTFTGNSQTFFLEGHRNLALKFFHDVIQACPEKLASLMTETKRG